MLVILVAACPSPWHTASEWQPPLTTTSGVAWERLWPALWEALDDYVRAGRRHLLTEDVVRFATVIVLAKRGITADRLVTERTVAGVGRVDLLVDPPNGAAIEFKFPRLDGLARHDSRSASRSPRRYPPLGPGEAPRVGLRRGPSQLRLSYGTG